MIPVEPAVHEGARRVVYAENQPQYDPLPASVDAKGVVCTEWEPTAEERLRLSCGGRVRLWQQTFGDALQPVSMDVVSPEGGVRES